MSKNLKINSERLLPWEDHDKYETLFAGLLEEHSPQGPTERHLVEELAGLIWRLQRVGIAEAALHRHGLSQARLPFKSTVKHAYAYVEGSEGDASVSTALTTSSEDRDLELSNTQEIIAATEKALEFAENGKYEPALEKLHPDTVEWWDETIEEPEEDGGYENVASSKCLARWIRFDVMPWIKGVERTLNHQEDIRNQSFGESLDPEKFNELGRWEAHLDRKLERTLAMLMKLKQLRTVA